jgi:hypothetical protein
MRVGNVLVVAGLTAGSDELHAAMLDPSLDEARFTLVMPRRLRNSHDAIDAAFCLNDAIARATDAGLAAFGRFGDVDPVVAAVENFDPWRVDRLIVCTLPAAISRWCQSGVPQRIRRLTGAPVIHVQAVPMAHGSALANVG